MEKKIENYLHLFLGCKVVLINDLDEDYGGDDIDVPPVGSIGQLKLINNGDFNIYMGGESEEWPYGVSFKGQYIAFWDCKSFKPILRPLSDMKIDELKVLASWSGVCSPNDWEAVPNEPYKVKHIKCENTFEIASNGDLVSKKSRKWKDFDQYLTTINNIKTDIRLAL